MIDSVDRHVARRIRGKRIALGLSQDSLANAIGIASELIEQYERMVSPIPAEHLEQLSQVLGVPVSYFMPASSCSGL